MFRPSGERPVVSGLGISSESEVRGPLVAEETRPDLALQMAAWEQPPPSRKELGRKRRGLGSHGEQGQGQGRALAGPAVSPEMRDRCFRCLEKGHFKVDCTNDIVCFRCGLPGHGSKDCKRPWSLSLVDELRRDVVAKVARRSTPQARPELLAPAPRGTAHRVAPPPQLPLLRDARPDWPPLAPPRLQTFIKVEEDQTELCIIQRS